jgi:hypothetical protein
LGWGGGFGWVCGCGSEGAGGEGGYEGTEVGNGKRRGVIGGRMSGYGKNAFWAKGWI